MSPAPQTAAQPKPALELVSAWDVQLPAPPTGLPAWDAKSGFVPLESGEIVAVALDTGMIGWRIEARPSALAAGGGLVYLVAGDRIEALDASTGLPRWRFDAGEELVPALAWDGGWLLAGTADGEGIMFRAADGLVLWRLDMGAALERGIAMTGDRFYLLMADGRVGSRSLRSGEPVWERKLPGKPTALLALDDRIFVGAEDKFLHCLSSDDGDERWRWRTGGVIIGTPAVDEDRVYFLALDNVLRALDRGNGHQRWQRNLGFRPAAGPFFAGQLLMVSAVSPDLALYRADKGTPAGRLSTAGDPAAPPHVLTGPAPGDVAVFVLTREGGMQRLGPVPPVLGSKPVPGLPAFLPLDR